MMMIKTRMSVLHLATVISPSIVTRHGVNLYQYNITCMIYVSLNARLQTLHVPVVNSIAINDASAFRRFTTKMIYALFFYPPVCINL